MKISHSRVLCTPALFLLFSALVALLPMGAVASAEEVPYLVVDGDDVYEDDTGFGVSWQVVYPASYDEQGWSTYCRVDGGAEDACTADTVNAMTLAEGTHTVELTPRNQAAGLDGTTYVWTFTVDVTAPIVLPHDDTPLARMGRDIVVPRFFADPQTGIMSWSCAPKMGSAVEGSDRVVLASPDAVDSVFKGYQCRAYNSRWMWTGYEDLQAIWDARKPYVGVDRNVAVLMKGPVGPLRVQADDYETAAARDQIRMRARYQVITPDMETLPWRAPAEWAWTRAPKEDNSLEYSTGFRLGRVPVGHYACLQPGAIDAVGWRSWGSRKCVVRAWDDRNLRRGAGWTATTPRGAYLSTALRTTRQGATLTLTRPSQGRAAAILVRKCPRCGSIEMLGPNDPDWGAAHLRYSLRAKTSRWATVPVDWWDHRYRGDYEVRVTSRGRPVEIDGLAVSPWVLRSEKAWTDPKENY